VHNFNFSDEPTTVKLVIKSIAPIHATCHLIHAEAFPRLETMLHKLRAQPARFIIAPKSMDTFRVLLSVIESIVAEDVSDIDDLEDAEFEKHFGHKPADTTAVTSFVYRSVASIFGDGIHYTQRRLITVVEMKDRKTWLSMWWPTLLVIPQLQNLLLGTGCTFTITYYSEEPCDAEHVALISRHQRIWAQEYTAYEARRGVTQEQWRRDWEEGESFEI
jgi:hypothetical protein